MDLVDARFLTLRLMREYGLMPTEEDAYKPFHNAVDGGGIWYFRFDNHRRRFGSCHGGRRVITLSRKLVALNNEDRVRSTVLHEIAHALTPGHGHDRVWRRKALELGDNGERCCNVMDTVAVVGRWMATCQGCGRKSYRYRAPKPFSRTVYACTTCCRAHNRGRFASRFVLTYVDTALPPLTPAPEGETRDP